MTIEQHEKLGAQTRKLVESNYLTVWELAEGYLRYEALRKLGPASYAELHRRNLAGERFDDMVDELVLKGLE